MRRGFKRKIHKSFLPAFEKPQNGAILYLATQSCGVTVAQVILVHFVEVRILTGLPFFVEKRIFHCSWRRLDADATGKSRKHPFSFCPSHPLSALWSEKSGVRHDSLREVAGRHRRPALRRFAPRRILTGLPFLSEKGLSPRLTTLGRGCDGQIPKTSVFVLPSHPLSALRSEKSGVRHDSLSLRRFVP